MDLDCVVNFHTDEMVLRPVDRTILRGGRTAALEAASCQAQLALAEHVHDPDAGDSDHRRPEALEAQCRPGYSFDRLMVLLDDVVEEFHLADLDVGVMLGVVAFNRWCSSEECHAHRQPWSRNAARPCGRAWP